MSTSPPPMTRQHARSDVTPSDYELLLGFGRGDPQAGHAFVQRYQRRVYGLAQKLVGDRRQAEDIAQEALIRAWRNADSFDARRGSVSSWLLTITRNLAIDAVRKKSAQPTEPNSILFAELPAQGAEPDDAATVADDTDRVRAALRLLPDEQRRALLLAAFYGLSAREVSEAEAIPLGTAKSLIRSSLRKMRSLLGEELHSDETDTALELIRSSSAVV